MTKNIIFIAKREELTKIAKCSTISALGGVADGTAVASQHIGP
jgi:hypothetical protein